jgi:predicted Rossmann-fold nucleotide-binding protein
MVDRRELISPGDLHLFSIVETPEEAVEIILDYERRVGPPDVVPMAFR